MTELMKKAVDKIDKETEIAPPGVKGLAQLIIDNFINSDENAKKILDSKKSFKGLLEYIAAKTGVFKVNSRFGFVKGEDEDLPGYICEYYNLSLVSPRPVSTQAESNIVNFDIFADL